MQPVFLLQFWGSSELLTTGIGQPIVSGVEIDVLRDSRDENGSRLPVGSRRPVWHVAVFILLRKVLVVATTFYLGACKQPLVVGEYKCPVSSMEGGTTPSKTDPISIPWSTGFENQVDCDYKEVGGSCYGFPPASFRVVASPVHTGEFAAEFTVVTGTDAGAQPQGRCIREGVFPAEAYYGAWYYIPESATNTGLWNLFHFQGGDDYHGLWDVSLVNGSTDGSIGALNLHVYDFLNKTHADGPPIPIATWKPLPQTARRKKMQRARSSAK